MRGREKHWVMAFFKKTLWDYYLKYSGYFEKPHSSKKICLVQVLGKDVVGGQKCQHLNIWLARRKP